MLRVCIDVEELGYAGEVEARQDRAGQSRVIINKSFRSSAIERR